MAMSIGTAGIPQQGVWEIDASGQFVPSVVYGVNAPLNGATATNAQLGLGTTASIPAPNVAGGGNTAATGYNTYAAATNPGYGSYGGGYSANPFDYTQPGTYSAPAYVGSQVLYGHYTPTMPSEMTKAEAEYQGVTGSGGAAPTGDTAPTTATGDKNAKTETTDKAMADKAKTDKAAKADEKKPAAKTITVASGDTLSALGEKHGIPWRELYQLNKDVIGGDPNLIKPGQVLKLPS